MHVVVSIVGFRNPGDVERCLAALARSTHTDFSVHLCENGGAASFAALIAQLEAQRDTIRPASARDDIEATATGRLPGGQKVTLALTRRNLGFAGGVNRCLEAIAAQPEWGAVWLLNPDTEVEPDALAALVVKARDPNYGIIGSRVLFMESGKVQAYGGRWRRWLGEGANIGFGEAGDAVPDEAAVEYAMDYVPGMALFATRAFIDAAGLMDESYFLYVEEVDWCFRRGSLRLGFASRSVVRHAHGSTIGSHRLINQRSQLSTYLSERNGLRFTRRHFPARFPLVAIVRLAHVGRYLAAGASGNARAALRGWLAGIIDESGPPRSLAP